jgi:hypothetical protein
MATGFVCTWCGQLCLTRLALEDHFEAEPACGTNQTVSNQTQSKYGDLSDPNQYNLRLGEETLQKVGAHQLEVIHGGKKDGTVPRA